MDKGRIAKWIEYGLNVLPIRLIEKDDDIEKSPIIKKGVLTDVYNGKVFLGSYALDKEADAYAICLTAIWKDNKPNFEEWIVGIDCDDQKLAEAIDILMPDTSKQKTRRGYHWLFIINEDIRKHFKDDESYAKHVKVNNFKVEVYLGKRYFVTIGKDYEIIKDIDSIARLTFNEFIEIRDKIKKLLMLIDILKPFYKEGNRNDIDFALEGIFAKSNVGKEDAERYIKAICHYFSDNELKSRLTVLERTYKRAKEGKEVAGISVLVNVIGYNKALEIAKLFGKDISLKRERLISELEELYNYHTKPYTLLINLLIRDLENKREEALFMNDYIFVTKRKATREDNKGSWYKYNRYVWIQTTPYELTRLINEYIDKKVEILNNELKEELKILYEQLNNADGKEKNKIEAEIEATRKHFMKFIKLLNDAKGSGKRVSETVHTMEANFKRFCIYEDQLNNYPSKFSINTKTHLLVWDDNLKMFNAIEHGNNTKYYYLTEYANVNYSYNADCPKFRDWLLYVSNNDKELARYLAIIGGSCLIDRVDHKCIINFGGGRNGKSTYMKVLLDILNDKEHGYSIVADVGIVGNTNTDNKDTSYQPDLYEVVDKRFVAVDEPNLITINASKLKKVTSQGEIMVRTTFKRPKIVKPDFTLLIFTNKRPRFTDTTFGTMRRLIFIKWTVEIPKEKDIKDYHNILLEEREGIFNLFLAGAREFIINGCDLEQLMPDIVKYTTDEYRYSLDIIREFLESRFIYEQNYALELKQVYDMYIKFCEEKELPENIRISKRKFADAVEEQNMYKVKRNGTIYLTNYKPIDTSTISEFSNNNNDNDNSNNRESKNEDQNNTIKQEKNDKPKNNDKIEKFIVIKGEEVKVEKGCSKCNEIKPKGISIAMFIAKHKCFRDKDIEIRIVDSKNKEWRLIEFVNDLSGERLKFECLDCHEKLSTPITVTDDQLAVGLELSHASN